MSFQFFLNNLYDVHSCKSLGNKFHSVGPPMLKLLAASVFNLTDGITSLVEMPYEDLRFLDGGGSFTNKSVI